MCDQFDGDPRHHVFEPSLCAEPLREPGPQQCVFDPQAQPASYDDTTSALRKRYVAGHASQREAKAIDRGCGKTVFARQAKLPKRFVLKAPDALPLDRCKRFIDVNQTGS
jgi:hypothetical protein